MHGLLGKKVGMTRIFDENGHQVPVTVLEAGPCVVIQRKSTANDGYDAVQYGFEDQREARMKKPQAGHFKRADASPKRYVREFRLEAGEEIKVGDIVTASIFEGVPFVNVTGVSKGKGFQGVVKRYGMAGGRKSHGAHAKRSPGSIGSSAFPARVAKGKHLPGHMGHMKVTTQNLRVIQVVAKDNLLLVGGSVAGPVGGLVVVNKALKKVATS